MPLGQSTILVVDPDADAAASLATELRRERARCFVARDAAAAVWGASETLPDAIVTELSLPDRDAHELVEHLRGTPECRNMVALGLTADPALAGRAEGRSNALDKYLSKPVPPSGVAEALACALGLRRALDADDHVALDGMEELVKRREYSLLLRSLNAPTDYRYTAYLYPSGETLRSVWTYDRERPRLDAWPLDLPTSSTPCALLATATPLLVEDSYEDPRIPPAQRHASMRAFAGAALLDERRRVTGVLCHFSPSIVSPTRWVSAELESTARLLAARVPRSG